jgi:Rap1a immunity proteins
MHKNTLNLVAVVLMLVSMDPAAGGFFLTGNALKSKLEKVESNYFADGDATLALGYVMGVSDVYSAVGFICSSNYVTSGQVAAVVLKYMREHPEQLDISAEAIIFEASKETWPCKNKSNPNEGAPPRPHKRSSKPRVPENLSPF